MTRPRPPASITGFRVVESYRDHTRTAQREHTHGRLLPMDDEAFDPWKNWFAGLVAVFAIIGSVWLAIIAFSPASDAPASSIPPAHAVEASGAGYRGARL